MCELKIGSIAELKSGGPEMTVSSVRGMNNVNTGDRYDVTCSWFSEVAGVYLEEVFDSRMLKTVKDGDDCSVEEFRSNVAPPINPNHIAKLDTFDD